MRKKVKRTPISKKKRCPAKKPTRTPVSGPLILSKKDPRDDVDDFGKVLKEANNRALKELSFVDRISREDGYIEELTETNLEPTRLYEYQRDFMLDRSKYRHGDKSRQIGMSYGFSCEGYAKSQLLDLYTGMFVSYNQEEANEKITYARTLHESTPYKYKKKIIVERVTALEWEGRTPDGRKTRARLISHPQREPRGKGFNTDVFLDEIAHYQWPERVYVAAVPIVTRGLGQLSMASSPLGKGGLHYEIGANVERYSMFSRHKIYWWNNPDFLNKHAIDTGLDKVHEIATPMETPDRVAKFGNDAIVQAYFSMLEEYFQQEYELRAIDELSSYFPMDLIRQCTFEALRGIPIEDDDDIFGESVSYDEPVYPGVDFKLYETVEQLSHAIARGIVTKRLYAGFDIGRNEDRSEIMVLEEIPGMDFLHICRLFISLKGMEFREQFNIIEHMFGLLPIIKLKVDSTGIGKNLAEDLQRRFHSRIDDVHFTNENKGSMAGNLKLRMEDQAIAYPNDKNLIRQIHSIKRKVTESSMVKFEVAAEERRMHHGDKFWALALASSAGEPAQMHKVKLSSVSAFAKIKGTQRLLQAPKHRVFQKLPRVLHGVDYKSLPPPPRHFSDLSVGVLSRDATNQ